ncbi:hypothetical protein [Paucibacter soli]|uniref:hypothetical protein n=1 Tax=Paucibacter soli TaxID=3133433 RepID=UPI0030958DDB
MENALRLWHGAQSWEPPPTIRPPKKGQAEHGAGIYCCAHYLTARKYAAGGGLAMDIFLKPNLRFLEDIKVQVSDLIEAARSIPRLRARDQIISDLERCGARASVPGVVGLNVLVNLAVNYDAMIGQPAVEITKFIVSRGADASLYERTSGDDWLVIFNPEVILAARKRPSATIDLAEYDRPRVRDQLERLRVATETPGRTAQESASVARGARP